MRKKAHRRINANNHEYDRFYVINYLVKPFEPLVCMFTEIPISKGAELMDDGS